MTLDRAFKTASLDLPLRPWFFSKYKVTCANLQSSYTLFRQINTPDALTDWKCVSGSLTERLTHLHWHLLHTFYFAITLNIMENIIWNVVLITLTFGWRYTVDQIMVHILDFWRSLFVSIFLVDVDLKMAHGQ